MQRRPFGFHWLAGSGARKAGEGKVIEAAAKTAKQAGCTLFELACTPVNGMPVNETADALLAGGIDTFSYCRFFPYEHDGPYGDPLGEADDVARALKTIEGDVAFIEAMRGQGLKGNFMTGPNCFQLGKIYQLDREQKRDRICAYYEKVGPIIDGKDIVVGMEYLRPGEDMDTIGGMQEAVLLIKRVNNRKIRIQADIYHMRKRHEVPHQALLLGGDLVCYLHAHGDDRLVPGTCDFKKPESPLDQVNWHLVGCALRAINFQGPVVAEPFGEEICNQVPALKEGLTPVADPRAYYDGAYAHLDHAGVLTY